MGASRGFGALREQSDAQVARLVLAPIDIELARGIGVRRLAFRGNVPARQLDRGFEPVPAMELCNECDGDVVMHSALFAEPVIMSPNGAVRTLLRAPTAAAGGPVFKSFRAYCAASGAAASGTVEFASRGGGASPFDQLQVLSIHRGATVAGNDYVSFDDKLLSASEPIKVRYGERVRFHFSNTSNLRGITLGLPQHRFLVVALDGHEVPTPRHVERIHLGPAESVDALVTMNRPGRWVLGATHREDRVAGLGRLVEYAGATGRPVEGDFGIADWDYSAFGSGPREAAVARTHGRARAVTPLSPLQIVGSVDLHASQFRDPTPQTVPLRVCVGERYRAVVTNLTRDPQPLHLPGHDVELVRVAGQRSAGVRKDVVMLPSFTRVEFEFDARSNEILLAHNRQVSLTG